MGKSSSSLKKKRSRNRSQSRTMKKSKSKSKNRRSKSKKHRRRNHSVSYSDDSDSRSMVSVSSSSSEDDYANQRSRSRARKDVKGSNKRVPRRSLSSSESSLDSFRGRKQKRSRSTRRDGSYERRKRTDLKKKPRRGVSVSSASRGSRSCSTCPSGSTDESEFERRRGKSERKEKQRKRFGKLKTGTKKSRDRSRSCSSCSRYSEFSEYQSEAKVVEQSNSRRLRSVITVINGEKEEIELEGDEHKEEILYDQDDYLSSKSNDSNDGGIRREFSQHSHLASEKNKDIDGEKTDASNFRTGNVVESGKDGISSCDLVGKIDAKEERKSEASVAVGSLDGDGLESILRQRALENLRKFRGGMQTNLNIPTNQKDKNNANVNIPSKEKAESVQLKSTREDGAGVVTASQVSQQVRPPATRKDSFGLPLDGKTLEGVDGSKGSQTAVHDVASARDKVASACSPKEKVNVASSSVSIKPRGLRRKWVNTTLKQSSASQQHSQAMLIPRREGNESTEKLPQSAESQSDNKNGDKIKNVHDSSSDDPSSCPRSLLADVSSDKLRDGTKEGSQFEQKTMSVMRGGELVEVSYKVYIPKKAPALARRQLKR